MNKALGFMFALGLFLVGALPAHAVTYRYLDKNATGAADGTSWTDAWTTFDAALQGSVTPASSDTVIVYVRDGVYTENSASYGALYLRQNFTNLVTFRHDPEDATANVIIEPQRVTASSAETGARVLSTTANLTFEDLTFKNSVKALHNADSITGFSDSADMTVSTSTSVYYEGTAAINLTKDGNSTTTASTSIATTSMYQDAGGNVSFSLYIKDAAALAKLTTTGAVLVRVGSDSSNYFQTFFNKASFTTGWNHMWGYPRTTTVGSPTAAAVDYLEIHLVAATAGTTWSEGDFLIDDINSNQGGALNLNYSGTGINISDLTFRRVTFDTGYASNYGAVKYSPNNTTGTNVVDGLYFYDCIFNNRTKNTVSGVLNGIYINATKSTNYVQNLVIDGSTFNGGVYALIIDGAPDFLINNIVVNDALSYAFNIPVTGATQATVGTDTYGTIQNSTFETINTNGGNASHAAVVGTNQNNGNQIILRRNRFISPAVNGLVLKGTFNAIVESNLFEVNATGGAGFIFKGCTNCLARNNTIVANSFGLSGSDDAANWKNATSTYYNNYVKVTSANGRVFQFADQAYQLGGNDLDYNAYDVASSSHASLYGTIGADSTLASLAEAITAWASYGALYSGNDSHSVAAPSSFISAAEGTPGLTSFSPAIDVGTTTAHTTDYLGRSIYGPADIGAYEYQPPYTMGTHLVATSSSVRVYGDEKFRPLTATTSADAADLSVSIAGSDKTDYLDIAITTWETSGDYGKRWTETSDTVGTLTTSHTVGNLEVGTYYTVYYYKDNATTTIGTLASDGSGQITFDYTAGYSTVIFTITEDATAPADFALSSPENNYATTDTTLVLSWGASSDAGSLAKYQLYVDGVLHTDNISTATLSASVTMSSCGSAHPWYVRAVDSLGNATVTASRSFTILCPSSGGNRRRSVSQALPVPVAPNVYTVPLTPVVPTVFATSTRFSRNLWFSVTHPEIKILQQWLNAKGFTLAATGPGSPGQETAFFGPATRAALIRFQQAYNIYPSVGFFGPVTRAVIEKL
jgi:hypothetical protein